jgi:hypothetical protein
MRPSGPVPLQRPDASPSLAPAIHNLAAPPTYAHANASYSNTASPSFDLTPERKPRKSRGVVILLVALIGLGAAYGLAAQRGIHSLAQAKTMLDSLRGVPASAPPNNPVFSVSEEPSKPAAAAMQIPTTKAIDPSTLPAAAIEIAPKEATDIGLDPKAPHAAKKIIERAPVVAAVAAPAPRAAEPAPAPRAAEPAPAPAAPAPVLTGLSGAIQKAAGPTDNSAAARAQAETQEVAVARNGDIPESPAQGAIQGAVGAQRGAARACVAGQDSPSRATLTFASTGKVQSVSVSGPAAGTSAEGCIKNALSKVSVGPFRRPTFSISTTVTPP